MHYNQSSAAKGTQHGSRHRQLLYRSMQRAAVNIFKTENTYELLVFAPGRIREHFHLDVKVNELIISYTPPEGFPRPEWILREYSRGGFERTFTLDGSMDTGNISAKYAEGVLQVTIPVIPGKETVAKEIKIS
ncbi:MAG: Hsp20/alpha crystallin family protein [Ginsengibacter sp.]